MTSAAPSPDRLPASTAANQARPHRELGNHGDHDQEDVDGNDRHDVRGRIRHVNRNRSGHGSPGDSRRQRDVGARHSGAGPQDGGHHDSRHYDADPNGGAAPEGNRHDNRDGDRHGDVRDQIRRLRAQGGTYRSIAAAAGLAHATVHDLASGRRSPTPNTARAIGKVTGTSLRRARADAGGTRLRLRALHVMGHGSARIARALSVREMTIRAIVRGDSATVSTALRDAVTDLYDAWWDKSAPERSRAERGAATAARRRAIAGNWCPGAGLDDDELDTPGYRPKSTWKPATGTGTAPDIQPLDHPRKTAGTSQPPKQEPPVNNPAAQPPTESARPCH